ncbi:hypothetical protein DSECCO2_418510 [anaerobic digester metagenome]
MAGVEQQVEEIPTIHTMGSLRPDVRAVDPAIHGQANLGKPFTDDPGILQVVCHQGPALLVSLSRQRSISTLLGNVARPVEKRALPAVPHRIEHGRRSILTAKGFRHNGPAKPYTGKTGELGEAVDLDGALLGPFHFIDGARVSSLGDVLAVCAVEDDDTLVRSSVIDKGFQLVVGRHSAGRVIRTAQVDQVHLLLRRLGNEPILLSAGKVHKAVVATLLLIEKPGAPTDHIAVHIHRICRVLNGNDVVFAKQVLNVGSITLGAVTDKEFGAFQLYTVAPVVEDQGLAQVGIPLLIAVSSIGSAI